MKKIILNREQLTLMANAILKNLFPTAKKGDAYFQVITDEVSHLYMIESYYLDLKKSSDSAFLQGKFSQSNAEANWNSLRDAINSAEFISSVNTSKMDEYLIGFPIF